MEDQDTGQGPTMMTTKDAFKVVMELAEIGQDARPQQDHDYTQEQMQVARNIVSVRSRDTTLHSFQQRTEVWVDQCFGGEIAMDRLERCDRFLEEALELIQSADYPVLRIIALIDYVYNRPKGHLPQEVGGVMVTLNALCSAFKIGVADAGEKELNRVFGKINEIRAKQASKPRNLALPMHKDEPQESI